MNCKDQNDTTPKAVKGLRKVLFNSRKVIRLCSFCSNFLVLIFLYLPIHYFRVQYSFINKMWIRLDGIEVDYTLLINMIKWPKYINVN